MVIEVRLFAMLRERAGRDCVKLRLPGGATAGEALAEVAEQHGLGDLIERMPVVVAVNREYVSTDSVLSEGDELALIPPVSGGAGEAGADANQEVVSGGGAGEAGADANPEVVPAVHARVTEEQLDPERLARLVSRPGAGAVVTFCGTARDVSHLEYEAYREMAEERITAIVAETHRRHGLEAAAAEHRVGTVPLGEASVAVAVSAAHRAEAFAAAREIIDRVKAEAPIWKREVRKPFGDGRWVEGARAGNPGRHARA